MWKLVITLPTRNDPEMTKELQVQKGLEMCSSTELKSPFMKRKTIETLGYLIGVPSITGIPVLCQIHVL